MLRPIGPGAGRPSDGCGRIEILRSLRPLTEWGHRWSSSSSRLYPPTARATMYKGRGRAMAPKTDEASQMVKKTCTKANHRKRISQRAPSGGSCMIGGRKTDGPNAGRPRGSQLLHGKGPATPGQLRRSSLCGCLRWFKPRIVPNFEAADWNQGRGTGARRLHDHPPRRPVGRRRGPGRQPHGTGPGQHRQLAGRLRATGRVGQARVSEPAHRLRSRRSVGRHSGHVPPYPRCDVDVLLGANVVQCVEAGVRPAQRGPVS